LKFIEKEVSSTIEVKKSKFIAHLCPYDEFISMIARLKEEHPKARHFVYAYRYLNKFGQIVENSSDDGEPKGTSGRPTLKVLSGAEIINSGVVIVRYFGGTMLGTGGLVKAYSDSVNSVISVSEFTIYEKLEMITTTTTYGDLSKLEYLLNQHKIKIINKNFDNLVTLTLEATKEKFEELRRAQTT